MIKKEFKTWTKLYDVWRALIEKPDALYKIWDDLPYSIVELGLTNISENIKIQQREDNYSIIVEDICDNCLEKEKVSFKQFKCVLDYAANYNNNNLKYKYKNAV
jgi:hypothetical protein